MHLLIILVHFITLGVLEVFRCSLSERWKYYMMMGDDMSLPNYMFSDFRWAA